MEEFEFIEFASRREWRAWLEKNHDNNPGIWLVYYKKHTGIQSIQYEDAVEEALCFGWVDSTVHKIDEQRYRQLFTPRKANSTWSASNKKRIENLMRQGLMTAAGLAKVRAAQQNGSWDLLTDVENMVVPPDLQEALAANPAAADFFHSLNTSDRKMYLDWIVSGKRAETREKRIAETVKRLSQKLKLTD